MGGENQQFGTTEPIERTSTNLTVLSKIRIPDESAYNGEYGFDWLDINADTKEIDKIQGIDFNEIEYYFKPPENALQADPYGSIEPKAGTESVLKNQILEQYPRILPVEGKFVDQPYVLIKKEQEIELALLLQCISGELSENVFVTVAGNDKYEIELSGGTKEGVISKVPLTSKETTLTLKIKCIGHSSKDGDQFRINLKTEDGESVIGGFVMMENSPLKLTFRVIALVSNEGDVNTKAKALFEKFKNSGITKYLNENSLNQAGYEVELDNQQMFDNLSTITDLNEYLYAFDKQEWIDKGKYTENFLKKKKKFEKVQKEDGSYEVENGTYKQVEVEYTDPTNVLYEDTIDDDVMEAYRSKKSDNSYNEGFIILADYECKDNSGAFSRSSPLNHYAVFVYSSNIENKSTYAHEIGHMLGLPHSFFNEKEKESFQSAKDKILGPKGINENISAAKISKTYGHSFTGLVAIRDNIIKKINDYTTYCKTERAKCLKEKKHLETYYINYKNTDKVNSTQTKGEQLSMLNSNIDHYKECVDTNDKALLELKKYHQNNYIRVDSKIYFKRTDILKLLEESKIYYMRVLDQCTKTIVFYKEKSTINLMDYSVTKKLFQHWQIKVMREDIKHYIDIKP